MSARGRREGLHDKFIVKRADGSSDVGGKHFDCDYFVLDLVHDRHARSAILAYAASCRADFPELAIDLLSRLANPAKHGGGGT